VEEVVVDADAEVAGVVVDWAAVGEDCTALEDAAGVVDDAAWRGV
jgi:ribulose 1,5-bisphosphate synthetase/thiazole synthase